MPSNTSFWSELKERRVVRVGLVYLAVGWALIEGSQTLKDVLDLPDIFSRATLAIVVLGFPAAIFLAWAFQATPEGIRRAEPLRGSQQSTLPFLAGVSITLAAIASLAYLFYDLESGDSAQEILPDANVVAVLPFRVSAPAELAYLGGGFMDLLSARLDGEVGPRAVDPSAVAPAASRDETGPASVARTLGAGLVLTGSVVGNSDEIVADAELVNITDDTVVATATAEGPADSLSRVADQLVIQLLSLSTGEYTTSIASLTSTSSEALKSYLLGKQSFRNGDYYEGIAHLDEALAIDPTFALAAIARADGSTNTLTIGEEGNLEKAWENRDRLSARDLEYLEVRLPQTPRTQAETIAAHERLTRTQPDRVEAWYWLFENVWHANGFAKGPDWWTRIRAIGDKILELDPGYFPVFTHYVFMEPRYGTPERMRDTYQKMVNRPQTESFFTEDLFAELAAGGDQLVLKTEALADCGANALIAAPYWPLIMPEVTPPGYIEFVDAAFSESRRRIGVDISADIFPRNEYLINVGLGRPGRAAEVRAEAIRNGTWTLDGRLLVYSAVWHDVQKDVVADTLQEIDTRLQALGDESLSIDDARDMTAVEVWRYQTDSAYSNDTSAPRIRAAIERASRLEAMQLEAHALLLDAWSKARKREREGARTTLGRLIDIVQQNPGGDVAYTNFIFAIAAIYEEIGDPAAAFETLSRGSNLRFSDQLQNARLWHERARLAALLGDTRSAITDYERWLVLRAAAEPSLQPQVDAVRRKLADLRAAM